MEAALRTEEMAKLSIFFRHTVPNEEPVSWPAAIAKNSRFEDATFIASPTGSYASICSTT